jgi:Ca2+-binding RTX toxin-like protein
LYQENTVTFEYAEGSAGSETIYAADSGGYIDGNGAQDTLYGGLGDDTLIGGTSKDQLMGNEGADIFIFETGDAYDTIVDFSGSEDGDRILIQSDKVQSFEELNIYQRDEDTVIKYDGGGAIILSDYDFSLLEAEFFIFSDPAMVA